MKNSNLTDLDIDQIARREHDQEHDAQRVYVVGGNFTIDAKFPEQQVIKQQEPIIIEKPILVEKEVVVIQKEFIEVEKIVTHIEYKTIEIPTFIKEIEVLTIEKPIIIKEIEIKEILISNNKWLFICLGLQSLAIIGIALLLIMK